MFEIDFSCWGGYREDQTSRHVTRASRKKCEELQVGENAYGWEEMDEGKTQRW